jgi:NADH-quinone oxidoreductase subunit E
MDDTLSQNPDSKTAHSGNHCKKEHRFSDRAVAELQELISHYPDKKSAMLPALWLAQREYGGYLTPQAIQEVADRLERSRAEVEGVATFYSMYNFQPKGKHHLEVCTCLTCGCVGAYQVLHRLEEKLGIHVGESTSDGEFSLSEVECLDWCEAGTVIQVGNKYFGYVTPDNVDMMLEQLKETEEYSPVNLAEEIIRVQLPGKAE